jgi:hypothetical protein
MKPVTAPMTITGIRSVCPPNSPSKRASVKGIGKKAHPAAAIPASTLTPCGMNVRISDRACPVVYNNLSLCTKETYLLKIHEEINYSTSGNFGSLIYRLD